MTKTPHLPLFAKGFRPFFLGASLLGAALVIAWLGILFGGLTFAGRPPQLWHGHEMVYGSTLAVVAGYLLTAVGGWTGRETATGATLAWLTGLWALGRLGAWVGPGSWLILAQLVELAFLPVLLAVLGRCIVAARNWRNAGSRALVGDAPRLPLPDRRLHFPSHRRGEPGFGRSGKRGRLPLSIRARKQS